jgi:hypothetical protein
MKQALKNHWIKVVGMLMVMVALGIVGGMEPAADAQSCLPDCPSCSWCMFWSGGPVCLQPGQHACYTGNYLVCVCDSSGNCDMSYLGPC